jgi:hypothetical protein
VVSSGLRCGVFGCATHYLFGLHISEPLLAFRSAALSGVHLTSESKETSRNLVETLFLGLARIFVT